MGLLAGEEQRFGGCPALCAAHTPQLRRGLIHHPRLQSRASTDGWSPMDGGNARLCRQPEPVCRTRWDAAPRLRAAALAQGLAPAPALGRDHGTVRPQPTGALPGTGPASRRQQSLHVPQRLVPKPCASPVSWQQAFQLGKKLLVSKEKSLPAQPFTQTYCRKGLALSFSPYPTEMLFQTCCAENVMTFFSSHALVLIRRPRHAAMGRAQQLITCE